MDSKQLPALSRGSLQVNTVEDAKNIGNLFSLAGIFDTTTAEEAKGMTAEKKEAINAVKIIAGNALGLSIIDSMKLHLVKGKITLGYQQLLSMIRRAPGYDYRVLQNDIEVARVEFFKDGTSLGVSEFNTADMQRANLGGDNWRKYPAQMRLSKAVSAGVSAYCPEITGGPSYTPQDLDNDSDYDIDVVAEKPQVEEEKKPSASTAASPEPSTTPDAKPAAATTRKPAANAAVKPTTPPPASPPAPAVEPPSEEEPTDVQVIQGERPTFNDLGTVVEAGADNGWTPETIETFAMKYFADNGVDCSSEETIAATWTWDHINTLIQFVSENTPEAE